MTNYVCMYVYDTKTRYLFHLFSNFKIFSITLARIPLCLCDAICSRCVIAFVSEFVFEEKKLFLSDILNHSSLIGSVLAYQRPQSNPSSDIKMKYKKIFLQRFSPDRILANTLRVIEISRSEATLNYGYRDKLKGPPNIFFKCFKKVIYSIFSQISFAI